MIIMFIFKTTYWHLAQYVILLLHSFLCFTHTHTHTHTHTPHIMICIPTFRQTDQCGWTGLNPAYFCQWHMSARFSMWVKARYQLLNTQRVNVLCLPWSRVQAMIPVIEREGDGWHRMQQYDSFHPNSLTKLRPISAQSPHNVMYRKCKKKNTIINAKITTTHKYCVLSRPVSSCSCHSSMTDNGFILRILSLIFFSRWYFRFKAASSAGLLLCTIGKVLVTAHVRTNKVPPHNHIISLQLATIFRTHHTPKITFSHALGYRCTL